LIFSVEDNLIVMLVYYQILPVIGGLVCGHCLRPKDLTLDYKKGAESLYQKDYKPHDCYKAVPRVG